MTRKTKNMIFSSGSEPSPQKTKLLEIVFTALGMETDLICRSLGDFSDCRLKVGVRMYSNLLFRLYHLSLEKYPKDCTGKKKLPTTICII
jgi:hypothetical protein